MTFARRERVALAALLREVGEDAPTMCAGWQAGDLAAHLYVRERRPKALVGIGGGKLAHVAEDEMAKVRGELSYAEIVDAIEDGPPLALRPIDSAMNALEFFVHHEDVRRANGREAARNLSAEDRAELARRFGVMTLALPAPDDLPTYLQATDLDERLTWRLSEGTKKKVRRVRGPIGEVIVWTFGRRDAAHVHIDYR